MNRKQKEELVKDLHETFVNSSSIIITHINGLTVAESTELRSRMRSANCKFKVTKNKIAKLALKKTNFEQLDELFKGPTAIGSSKDEISPAKILVKFSNDSEKIDIVGGAIDQKQLSVEEINNLATLPTLDEIRSKLAGLLMAGPAKLVRTLNEPPSRLARILSNKT